MSEAVVFTAGKMQTTSMTQVAMQQENNTTDTGDEGNNNNGAGAANTNTTDEKPPLELADDQLKELLKGKGIEFEGSFDDLKNKLKPAEIQPTAEQLAAQESAFEKRMLDKFVAGGGKVEDFVSVKQMMNVDVAELSKSQLLHELKQQGFNEDEAKAIQKQMFLEEDLETIEQTDSETPEEFAARKAALEKRVKYGADNLANRSLHIKTTAQKIYDDLKAVILKQDKDVAEEAALSAKIEGHLKAHPKEITFEIGKLSDKDENPVEPIKVKVTDEILQKVSEQLKSGQREAVVYDENGNLDVEKSTNLLVRNAILESALKSSYIQGGTKQVEIFKQTFPDRSAYGLGVGGSPNKAIDKKQPVTAGKVQTVKFTPQN